MDETLPVTKPLDARQFRIAVKRLANGLTYGIDRSPYLGSGVEYVQSRPYQPGDPVKSIDWRVTARTRRLFVKQYETPKQLPTYLLIDTSASMAVRSGKRSKYELAVMIAGGIALACLERLRPVGVLGVGGRTLHIQPSLSQQQILQWLHTLRSHRFDEPTNLARRISELSPSLLQRAMVVVLSDLHDPEALGALKQLGQEHDCVVLEFRDPAESGLRGAGFLRAREAESGRAFVTHGRARWLDQKVIDEQLKRAAIDHLRIRTDEPFLHRLRHFFASRDLMGRGAR